MAPTQIDKQMANVARLQQTRGPPSPMADGPGAASLGMPPTSSNVAAYTDQGPITLKMEGMASRLVDSVTDGAKNFANGVKARFSKKTARYAELTEHKDLAVDFVDAVTIVDVLTSIGEEGKTKLNTSIQADTTVDESLRSGIAGLDVAKSYSLSEKALILKKLFEDKGLLKSSNLFEAVFEQGADKGVKTLVGLCVLSVPLEQKVEMEIGPIAEPKSLKEFIDSNAKAFLDELKNADDSPKKAKFGELSKTLQNERVSNIEELRRKVMDVYGRLPESVDVLFEDLVYTVKYQPKNTDGRLESLLERFGAACVVASIEGIVVVKSETAAIVASPKNLHTVVTDAVARFPDNDEDRREYQSVVGARLDKFKAILLSERAQTQLAFVDANPLAIFAAVKKSFEDQANHLKIAEEQYDEEQKAAERYRGKNSLRNFFSTGFIGGVIRHFKSDPKRPHPVCAGSGQVEGKDCSCMKSAAPRGRQNFLRRRMEGEYYRISRHPVLFVASLLLYAKLGWTGTYVPFVNPDPKGWHGGVAGYYLEKDAISSENQKRIADLETEPKVKELYNSLDEDSKRIWKKLKEDPDAYAWLLMNVFTERYGTFKIADVKKALELMDVDSISARLAQDPENERIQLELKTAELLLKDMQKAGRTMAETALDSFGKTPAKTESTVCFSCDDQELIATELGMRQRVLEVTTQVRAFLEFASANKIELPKNVAVLVELEFAVLDMLNREVGEGQDAKTVLESNLSNIKAFVASYSKLGASNVPSYMQAKITIQMKKCRDEDLSPLGAGGRLKRYSGMTKAESEQESTGRLTNIHNLLSSVSLESEVKSDSKGAAEGSAAPAEKPLENTKDGKLSLDDAQFEQLVGKTGLTKESIEQLVQTAQKLQYYFEYADVAELSNELATAAKAWPKDKGSGTLAFDLGNAQVASGVFRALNYLSDKHQLKKLEQPKENPTEGSQP